MPKKKKVKEHKNGSWLARRLRDIILGGQDGLVNVLGLVLGVASATKDPKIVIIAGLASTFAESISMGAVGYTSTLASRGYYESLKEAEEKEIEKHPEEARDEVRKIFQKKGFKGDLLEKIVDRIASSKRRMLQTVLAEEVEAAPSKVSPLNSAIVIFLSAMVGSIIPIIPFFLGLPVVTAMWWALGVSAAVLFMTGAVKAKVTVGSWWKSGIQITLIGILSAIAGYAIGTWLGVTL